MKVFVKALVCSAVLLSVTACSTINGLDSSDKGISFEVSNKPYSEIWKSSVNAMSTNLTIVEVDERKGVIKSEARPGLATWGEVVGVFIKPTTPSGERYLIRVISKTRSSFQITGQDWAPSVAARIQADLHAK
ncbi:hypothetical protein [Pseudomonas sp. RT6P73]